MTRIQLLTTGQISQEEPIRMQTLQKQDGNCSNHPSICRQASLPGAGSHERSYENVHQEKWYLDQIDYGTHGRRCLAYGVNGRKKDWHAPGAYCGVDGKHPFWRPAAFFRTTRDRFMSNVLFLTTFGRFPTLICVVPSESRGVIV